MPGAPVVQIGGPSYCMSVDARHAVTVGTLAATLTANYSAKSLEFSYEHGTPVDIPRNQLFASALASDIDVLVWLDSDTYIHPKNIPHLAELVERTHYECWTFTAIACLQRNSELNVWLDPQQKMKRKIFNALPKHVKDTHRAQVFATGLGCAVFNMNNFRNLWSASPWFTGLYGKTPDGKPCFQSEDYVFTSSLLDRVGVPPFIETRYLAEHVHRGGY